MREVWKNTVGVILVLAGIALPIGIEIRNQTRLRNFSVVRDGVLYRSSQLSLDALGKVIRNHGIRTVVCLRDGTSDSDRAEEIYCEQRGIKFVRIKPHSWEGVQGGAPIDRGLSKFLETVSDPANQPVLVHCYRGVHRTGQYVAVYRIELEGWTVTEALNEMVTRGYDLLDQHADVRGYFASYQRTGRYQGSR